MSGVMAKNFNASDSAGQIWSGYKVKVVNDDDNRCEPDTKGEIYIKTPYKFLGYLNQSNLSAEAIDNEGFFLSGDIGFVDKDGNVHLIDRKKDLFLYDFKISPFEIEEFSMKSKDIKAICVVGVWDGNTGMELPAAVIIREKGSNITESAVSKMVEDKMNDYCKLRGGVYFVESIPTAPPGKLLRRWCKETANKLFTSK